VSDWSPGTLFSKKRDSVGIQESDPEIKPLTFRRTE
jgi:hypothetical protein